MFVDDDPAARLRLVRRMYWPVAPRASQPVVSVRFNPAGSTLTVVGFAPTGSLYPVVVVTPSAPTVEVTKPKSGFRLAAGITAHEPPGASHSTLAEALPVFSFTSITMRCHPAPNVCGSPVTVTDGWSQPDITTLSSTITRTPSSAVPRNRHDPAVAKFTKPLKRPDQLSTPTELSGEPAPQFHDAEVDCNECALGAPTNAGRTG